MASYLSGGGRGSIVADLYAYGVPVFRAGRATRRYRVRCVRRWGKCELEGRRVPIPRRAKPSPGGDGAMVIKTARNSYEFWRARRARGRWKTAWGGIARVRGSGRDRGPPLPTGAGVSRLAGVVRTHEIRRGRINHALVFSTDNSCRRRFKYPAGKTDGTSDRRNCIPEGTRIQLKPWVDVSAIRGITRGERAVAKALQRYGAYAVDAGGARMALIFENPIGERDPYPAAGFSFDYFNMPHIPWKRVRVLRQWDGR